MANSHKKKDKKNEPLARVTAFLKGQTKKEFFEELERTGNKESKLAKEIIEKHYKKK